MDTKRPRFEAHRLAMGSLVVAMGALVGCQTTQRDPYVNPSIESFSAGPAIVCLNQGLPLVRVAFEVDLGSRTQNIQDVCITFSANGTPLQDSLTAHCMDVGTSGERTFNLFDHFGSNVPSAVEIQAVLKNFPGGPEYDRSTARVETRADCPPPGGLPG